MDRVYTRPNGDRWDLWDGDVPILENATGEEVAHFLCYGHSEG